MEQLRHNGWQYKTGTDLKREQRSLDHDKINAPILAKTVWKSSGGSSTIKSACFFFFLNPFYMVDRPSGPPSLLYNGYRVFPLGKERPGRDADPSPLKVPWSRKSRVIPLLLLWAVQPVQSLSASTGVHFYTAALPEDGRNQRPKHVAVSVMNK